MLYDTETVGFNGIIVLMQTDKYGIHDVWDRPVGDTLDLIEELIDGEIVCHNLTFDMFHTIKLYNIFTKLSKKRKPNFDEVLSVEDSRGIMLKPKAVVDTYLHYFKYIYQYPRKSFSMTKVPGPIRELVRQELNRIPLPPLMTGEWVVSGEDLKFTPKFSLSLKEIMFHEFGIEAAKLADLGCPYFKSDDVWKPYGGEWYDHFEETYNYWQTPRARQYALDDINYLKIIQDKHNFQQDIDDQLAVCVANCRWHGFGIDAEKIKSFQASLKPVNWSPAEAKKQLLPLLPNLTSTNKKVLEKITVLEDLCENADMSFDEKVGLVYTCPCHGTGKVPHPAQDIAKQIIKDRKEFHLSAQLDKLLSLGRFHPSYKVCGTLTNRLSGADGFNPQGMERAAAMRECFTLSDPTLPLVSGGDFDSYEVYIKLAVVKSEELNELIGRAGKKIHGLYGVFLYPEMTYDELLNHKEYYTRSKSAVFLKIYGGTPLGMEMNIGIPREVAEKADHYFNQRYPDFGKDQKRIEATYTCITGTSHFKWKDPEKTYAEDMTGFRRDFSFEYYITKKLFDLATSPPASWKEYAKEMPKFKRFEKEQTLDNAARTCLYGTAFKIMKRIIRQGGNTEIQAAGANLTKQLQLELWNQQPTGISEPKICILNVHDEILTASKESVKAIVDNFINDKKKLVPLLAMTWKEGISSWAEK